MMARKRFSGGGFEIFSLILALIIVSSCFSAVGQERISEQTPYEIFPLKNISFELGRKYLSELGIGTVSRFPGSNALLVTAQAGELMKARSILGLVDATEPYMIKTLDYSSEVMNLLRIEQIAATAGNISIGTFSSPPDSRNDANAIIDIHNGSLVIVAPLRLSDKIVSVIKSRSESYMSETQNRFGSQNNRQRINTPGPINTAVNSERQGLSNLTANTSGDFNRDSVKTLPSLLEAVEQQPPGEGDPALTIEELFAANQMIEEPNLPNGDQVVNLALGEYEKLTVVEFLGLVGPYLQLDFIYDEKDLAGEVTFNPNGKFRGPIKINDLYLLLETVLQFKNLAMTRGQGNLVTIAPIANAFDIDPRLLEKGVTRIERGDGVVTQVFELKYMSPSNAVTLINAMKLSVTPPISEGKSLIVTTYSNRIPRLERILEMIDKPGEPRKFRYRQLRYTMAQTLVPKLQTLAEQLGTVSITISAEEEEAPSPSPRRSSETAAQYAARLRREQQLRAQRTATAARTGAAEEQVQPSVFLDADERTNRILMIGDKEQLDAVEDLIDTLDVAQQDLRSLKLYKIENVDAEEVRDKLIEFGIIGATTQAQGVSGAEEVGGEATPAVQQRTPAARRRASARTGTEEQTQEALVEEPQVVVIEQTNSLLVNATEEQQKRIETIKDYVDSQVVQAEIPYKVYQLRNQGPEHLREILLPLIEETITTATGGDEQAKIQETRKKQEEPITIVADPNTFSLVVYANKKNQDWIETLITQLDKRRPQVLIDVTLVQISKTDSFEYDLNLLESFPDLTSTSGLTSAIMDIAAGANDEFDGDINHGVNLVPRLNGGRDRFIDFQSNNGQGTAFYGDKHINFLLTAMRQKDYGRVLAKPKILVNDNEQGLISTTDRTYVTKQTGTIIEGVTNAVQTAVDYQDYPAGITLTIVPHISESDLLRLDINLERSDFGTITGEKPPDTTESNVETTVTVPDGSTIILGGMIKLNQSKGGSKVPLLGDIPLLGGLFRSTSNSDIQRNLYVFVKAEIIRPPDDGYASNDLQQISDRTKNAFEKHELEFQKYQDWPGVKPQPMEPFKVLEAQ